MAADMGGFPEGGTPLKQSAQDGSVTLQAPTNGVVQRYANGPTVAQVITTPQGGLRLAIEGRLNGASVGSGSFDWQSARELSSMCASGSYSVAIGNSQTVSNSYSAAFGQGNKITSTHGGAFGAANDVLGTSGGFTAGSHCKVTQNWASAFGYYSSANASYSMAVGVAAKATIMGQFALSGSFNLYDGEAQANLLSLHSITTDATLKPLAVYNDVTARPVIPAYRLWNIKGLVSAFCQVTGTPNTYYARTWEIRATLKRDASNNTTIVGTPTIVDLARDSDAGGITPSTWAVSTITADDTNESLAINVIGQDATTIRWQASLFYSQVGF